MAHIVIGILVLIAITLLVVGGDPITGCKFGTEWWNDGQVLDTACLKLKCQSGNWKYEGMKNELCGKCQVGGDPHIHTWTPMPNMYNLKLTDEFSIAQPGKENNPSFGVKGNFEQCINASSEKTSIASITYNELTTKIKLDIEPALCTGNPATNVNCQIKVFLDGFDISVDTSVRTVVGSNGAILVFKASGMVGVQDLNCISIVGTTGLSMSLCAVKDKYPSLYIWAMPSLKSNPSELYGLCNIYTGVGATQLESRDGSVVPAKNCSTITTHNDLCYQFAKSWKI